MLDPETTPGLELALQELEPMEAPGFWTGFAAGVAVVGVAVSGAAVYTAISAVVAT